MKVANPFQASGSLNGTPQINKRERFKKVFFAILAVHVILFLTLLIQGCRSGKQAAAPENSEAGIAAVQN